MWLGPVRFCGNLRSGGGYLGRRRQPNNYAGAVDPDLLIRVPIGKAPEFSSLEHEVRSQFNEMHHNVGPNDPERYRGLAREPKVGLIGFVPDSEREKEYLARLPEGASVLLPSASELPDGLTT